MINYHWDTLEFRGKFSLTNFNKKLFLKELEAKNIGRRYRMFFESSQCLGEQHAHIDIEFTSSKVGAFLIAFHRFAHAGKAKDEGPPYMEDCVQWFGKFFNNDLMLVDTSCYFEFEDDYSSILALPFPLITESKELVGSLVTGMSIDLIGQKRVKSVIISAENDLLYITGLGRIRITLKEFDLESELKKFYAIIKKFVKKRENKK